MFVSHDLQNILLLPMTSDHLILSLDRNIMSRLYEDIIQILSLKTNNQMQSYSPLALSLSYQSSLPEKTSSVFTYIYTTQHICRGNTALMLVKEVF